MKRREFIKAIAGSAAAWPLAARGQPTATPVVTVINARKAEAATALAGEFRKGSDQGLTGPHGSMGLSVRRAAARPRLPRLPVGHCHVRAGRPART
jgi:hypothetical protein